MIIWCALYKLQTTRILLILDWSCQWGTTRSEIKDQDSKGYRLVRSSYGISQLGRGRRYEDGPCYLVGLERREQLEEINCYRKKTHKKLHDWHLVFEMHGPRLPHFFQSLEQMLMMYPRGVTYNLDWIRTWDKYDIDMREIRVLMGL